MSFILDALKKSEDERLGQSGPNLAYAHSGSRREGIPRWVIVLSALLLVNLAGLIAVMIWKSDAPADDPRHTAQAVVSEEPAPQKSVGFQASADYPAPVVQQPAAQVPPPVEKSRDDVRSLAREVGTGSNEPVKPPTTQVQQAATAQPITAPEPPVQTSKVETLNELLGRGRLMNLPALSVDLHVYAARKEDRFVFINLAKYQEGQRLKEGPLVEEITNDGVILQYQGERFLIPRS